MADPVDYLQTADVWAILDLIVAEWKSDPASCTCFDLRVIERATVLSEARRRAQAAGGEPAFVELADALSAWLATKGWRVLVVGDPEIRQQLRAPAATGHFLFTMHFAGSKTPRAPIVVPGDGGPH